MNMGADVGVVGSGGKVVGAKLTRNETVQINKLVEAGLYLNPSDFIRDAVREKLGAIKVIEYRDVTSWYARSWMTWKWKARWRPLNEGL